VSSRPCTTRETGHLPRRPQPGRRALAVTAACLSVLGAATVAVPAQARNLYTLDSRADSGGPIVVDASGNGYIAWSRLPTSSSLPDQTMFCKIPADGKCTKPIALQLPTTADGSEDGTDQPFPVVAGGGLVYVVAPRYVMDDTIIWTSTNGGVSFGAPDDIPMGSFAGQTSTDDVLLEPSEPYLTASPPVAYFDIASSNPGAGYSFVPTNEISGTTSFQFANPGSGGVAGSTLGEQPNGLPLYAYWNDSTPSEIFYYRATPGVAIGTSQAFAGPFPLGAGYLPAAAGGPKGLFLASEEYQSSNTTVTPSVVQVRAYNQTTNSFGAPVTLVKDPSAATSLDDGGTINENASSGEVGVVWPDFATSPTTMRLWTSANGGRSYTARGAIATVAPAFAANARLAVSSNGGGFATWQDSGGLKVADLIALPTKHPAKKGRGRK